MRPTNTSLARKFAEGISKYLSSKRLRIKLRRAAPQEEHKVMADPIRKYLKGYLKAQHAAPGAASYDWEGNKRRESEQQHSYEVLGTWAHPDSAVLGLFRCAFEFDREPTTRKSAFKDAFMKASVHVLSGAYQACVFVYTLEPRSGPHTFLDGKDHTRKLNSTLRAAGLYVCFIPTRSV